MRKRILLGAAAAPAAVIVDGATTLPSLRRQG